MASDNKRHREKIVPIDKRIESGGVDSILAVLMRKIMVEIGTANATTFDRLLERFISNPANGVPNNVKERSSARGNLRKELLRAVMSWRVFCKAIRFNNVPRFDITITLYHRNKSVTSHTLAVNTETIPIDNTPDDSLE